MLKIFAVIVIIILLRRRLAALGPHWHTLVPAAFGGLLGYGWACFLAGEGILAQIHQQTGISPGWFAFVSSAMGAGYVAARARPFLMKMFPPQPGQDRPQTGRDRNVPR